MRNEPAAADHPTQTLVRTGLTAALLVHVRAPSPPLKARERGVASGDNNTRTNTSINNSIDNRKNGTQKESSQERARNGMLTQVPSPNKSQ